MSQLFVKKLRRSMQAALRTISVYLKQRFSNFLKKLRNGLLATF